MNWYRVDTCGEHWVRIGEGFRVWRRQLNGHLRAWDEIDVPDADHVLSEGWSAS